jgi:glucosyl-dolichyl phosphate glucuronosyltransferase
MDVTVAICTWNRADLLDHTLIQLQQQAVPAGVSWELLVVDNNSTDHTLRVLERHAQQLPLRVVGESQQGHCHARNRAVAEARGELILWTDDDVHVSPNWIAEYVRVARDYPQAGYFGGRVTPWFADDVPPSTRAMIEANWPHLRAIYSLKDYGTHVGPFQRDEGPFGSNMGFRTELLRRFPFNPQLGRVKTDLIGGDEIAVVRAMQRIPVFGVWIGTTEVQHYIPAARTTYDHFWKYYFALGQTHVRLHGREPCATIAGRPRWAVVSSLQLRAKSWMRRQWGASDWLGDYLKAAWLTGLAQETAHREP